MPKAFTETEKKQIHQRLLEEGAQRFASYGLRKTNVEELAAAAGISKGAFYIFFASKETLFMDVVEEAERQFRLQILDAVDEPGPSPRARLTQVLLRANRLWREIPVLQFFSQNDYASLAGRMPPESLQEHLASDYAFAADLIQRCRNSGIPVQIGPQEFINLLYMIFFSSMHEQDFAPHSFTAAITTLIELVAAYCLGEIELTDADQLMKASQL